LSPASKDPHQTGFAYEVGHLIDAPMPFGRALELNFTNHENVIADRIWMESRPWLAGPTN
jgi:hypothetical protein